MTNPPSKSRKILIVHGDEYDGLPQNEVDAAYIIMRVCPLGGGVTIEKDRLRALRGYDPQTAGIVPGDDTNLVASAEFEDN